MHRQYLAACFVMAVSIASVMIALPVCEGKEDSPGFSVRKNEVSFTDGSALLQGTMFLPELKANVPGVVILGGAERGPRNPYKEGMAAFFASNGIAALIYDSPGTGRSTGNALLQTKDDRVREAANALHFLCAQDGVNAKEVGIWGISEGANIALLAAARERSAATLKRLLVRGGQDLTVEIIPRASHTMTYSGSNDFAGGYASLMVDWLKARFGIPSPGDE